MPSITFDSLLTANSEQLASILSDARVRQHMPLADSRVDTEWVEKWRAAKVAQWKTDSDLGPWAVYIDGQLAGWGGLQPEDNQQEAGLAMVLAPEFWGYGIEAMSRALELFRNNLPGSGVEVTRVLIEFPESRRADSVLAKFGFERIDSADIGGVSFNRYAKPLID